MLAHVHGFRPYFYVAAPSGFLQSDLTPLKDTLNVGARVDNGADQCSRRYRLAALPLPTVRSRIGSRSGDTEAMTTSRLSRLCALSQKRSPKSKIGLQLLVCTDV